MSLKDIADLSVARVRSSISGKRMMVWGMGMYSF